MSAVKLCLIRLNSEVENIVFIFFDEYYSIFISYCLNLLILSTGGADYSPALIIASISPLPARARSQSGPGQFLSRTGSFSRTGPAITSQYLLTVSLSNSLSLFRGQLGQANFTTRAGPAPCRLQIYDLPAGSVHCRQLPLGPHIHS